MTVTSLASMAGASTSTGAWQALRQCESGGDYATNTGNGYYGAYQFSLATWQSLGYSGLPSDAPAATQDQAARQLLAQAGPAQWPVCSVRVGLTSADAGAGSSSAASGAVEATSASGGGSYTVQAGDTLWAIASRYGTSVGQLVAQNNLADPGLIHPGTVLRV
ncbi:MAG TPA: transglycosylase family protein [Acidimicrobiales bacterium]|jgi:LysM repeat protein|nr:transglycosylase family protein [Acidimicrobiales bacterium]